MTYRVKYKKTFVSGSLKGVTVDGGWSCPDEDHLRRDLRELRAFEAQRAIRQEILTKNEYFIHHVGHEVRV